MVATPLIRHYISRRVRRVRRLRFGVIALHLAAFSAFVSGLVFLILIAAGL